MNSIKSLIAIVATVAAAGAFAQEATIDTTVTRSVESRMTVHDQAAAARASGTIAYGEAAGYNFTAHTGSSLSRAQVAAEAREAQRLGLTQGGEAQRVATPSQLESIQRAGKSVAGTMTASR
jgi:hypothetical protein